MYDNTFFYAGESPDQTPGLPPGGDKVSMLTHTYPHKPIRKIKVTVCNHQADSPLYVLPDVWSGDLQDLKKYGHIWHQMSLLRPGIIKQTNNSNSKKTSGHT